MADFDESQQFDIDELLTEELMAELYYEEEEQMQDEDIELYDSDNENMQQEEDTEGTPATTETAQEDNIHQEEQEQQQQQNDEEATPNRKQLTMFQRREIVDAMLLMMQDGALPRGYKMQLSTKFKVHKSTITRIFTDIKKQMAEGNMIDVRTKKLGKTGPKPREFTDEFLQSVPLYLRQTERSYAAALNISHVTLHNLKKKGRLRTHTASCKPALSADHKIARMKWVLSKINPVQGNQDPTFEDMSSNLHIDEKWFYLNPDKRRFYLLPSEEDPYMAQQSRRFKLKAMFMAIIGKPLYGTHGELIHDGKYGIFPFTVHDRAKKSSKNRAAGTMVTRALQNVNREVIRDMLLNKVIPAIKDKWPESLPKDVTIQWDNARPHQIPTDEEFVTATTSNGFNIQFVFQPAQSPDLNVLDLGLFRSIQSLQYQSFPKNLDELVDKVIESYNTFKPEVNKYIWVTLQRCMIKILKAQGGNRYKIPHMNKKKLENLGVLPNQVYVQKEIVLEAVEYLNTMFRPAPDDTQGTQQDFEVDAD